jgi:hypothetical protein
MFQSSQVVVENEQFLFADQQVELLPARTTMTTMNPGGGKKKKNNNKAVAVATAVNVAIIKGDNNLVFQNAEATATANAG